MTPSTNPEPTWSDGARDLARYLADTSQTIHKFCTDNGLDYAAVHKVLNGWRGQRVTVDFALAIERATNGVVHADAWRSETQSSEQPVSVARPRARRGE